MPPAYEQIPEELRARKQWVVHKNKSPHSPRTGRNAKVNEPDTWDTFEAAVAAVSRGGYDGIGFVFTEKDPYVGIDFDHCYSGKKIDPWVREYLRQFDSYTEISYSGTGFHVICKGHIPENRKTSRAEIYSNGRYFTMSGYSLGPARPIRDASGPANKLYAEISDDPEQPIPTATQANAAPQLPPLLSDDEVIERATNAQNGQQFERLWRGDLSGYGDDHSKADLALCNLLAYWCRKDIDQMDRLFRQSGLMREKWDRRQTGSTYGRLQLEKAAREAKAVYDPQQYRDQEAMKAFEETPLTESTGLNFITASDLNKKQLPPVRFLVDGILPQGLALLSAPPKYGKSWFVLDLCLCVSTGSDFIGHKTTKAGCLYLALEDSENRIQSRMRKLLRGMPAPDNFAFVINAPDLDNGLLGQLEGFLKQKPDTGLIVIDTLQKIRGGYSRNESAYKCDYREVGAIKAFADRNRILVVLVHHLRKMADDGDPHNRISGTNGIMGAADTSLVLSRAKRTDSETTLSITGRDVDAEELLMRMDEECRWHLTGSKDESQRKKAYAKYLDNPLVKVIRQLVFDNGGVWRGRMKALNDASVSILGDKFLEDNELRKYPGKLRAIKDDLERYDGITYERLLNGANGGGSDYVFKSFVQIEQDEEWDSHNGD